jgi:hypothetical protein
MIGCEGIEASSVERASLDIGERLAFERVPAVVVEVADAVLGPRKAMIWRRPSSRVCDTATMPDLIL